MSKTIFVGARKGGVGKTMTAASLGFGLARQGKRVLLLDCDSQHSLTVSLGIREPDKLNTTLASVMTDIINERDADPAAGIVRHDEGVDFLPASAGLTGIELALTQLIGRETVLRQYIDRVKGGYDYVIIDTAPSLDLLTVNALAAADSAIVPVCPKYLDALGLEQLLKAVAQIKRQINPTLAIDGILLTMVDRRANLTREVIASIENAYGKSIRIFDGHVPQSVKAAECSAQGVSIYAHDPNGKVAGAYNSLVGEVLRRG
uniref:Chromosome (Plasmid) partitioning protein ParA / Sporulation initiation inhibitor protein Soj n=1 Tax=uncultured bacterium contig00005 TaxID=1181497 RepID=A0A806KD24_9BACT|nr:chromosome (plasmid) partitioning protein ParA / Sporulation initiation inhibitor protein Soj [uncultured bacterium contig00005]